jgi:hypothetical protein
MLIHPKETNLHPTETNLSVAQIALGARSDATHFKAGFKLFRFEKPNLNLLAPSELCGPKMSKTDHYMARLVRLSCYQCAKAHQLTRKSPVATVHT